MIRLYGDIKRFSGQGTDTVTTIVIGVEKNNDSARRSYFLSDHMDAPKDVLLTEARRELLSSNKRGKRSYQKKDMTYWNERIFVKRHRSTED